MRTYSKRTPTSRKFRPLVFGLEDRCTPTVTAIGVLGLTPGLGGGDKVSIGGLIGESNSVAASTLSVNYWITDSHGTQLDSGTLNVKHVLPKSDLLGFSKTLPLMVAPGETEIIVIGAMDADSQGVPMMTSAALYISPNRGVSTVGIGVIEQSGDTYSGYGVGHVALTSLGSSGILAKGTGRLHITSGANNDTALNADLSGKFQFGLGTQGNLGISVKNGSGVLNVGTYAGDTTANGGMTARLNGNVCVTRYADASLSAQVQGNVDFAAVLNNNSTNNTAPTTLSGQGRKVSLCLKTDGQGNFKLGLAGKLRLGGYLDTSNVTMPV